MRSVLANSLLSPTHAGMRLAMLVTVVTAWASFCLITAGSDLFPAGDAILQAGFAILIA